MSNYTSAKTGREKLQWIVSGMLLCSWLVLGNGGVGVASTKYPMLQIHGNRITGVLRQVPLRTVLARLREKLAIEYVVSNEELDKPVSANFAGELVTNALSKILASWDYALQVDQQGRVQQIFVVTKIGSTEIKKSSGKTSESIMAALPGKMMRSEPIHRTHKTQVFLPGTENASKSEAGITISPMFSGSSQNSYPMNIPSPQGSVMGIQPTSKFMQVIPASAYPPMDILPVSGDVQMEFIKGYN